MSRVSAGSGSANAGENLVQMRSLARQKLDAPRCRQTLALFTDSHGHGPAIRDSAPRDAARDTWPSPATGQPAEEKTALVLHRQTRYLPSVMQPAMLLQLEKNPCPSMKGYVRHSDLASAGQTTRHARFASHPTPGRLVRNRMAPMVSPRVGSVSSRLPHSCFRPSAVMLLHFRP